jgi:hypothetical protein
VDPHLFCNSDLKSDISKSISFLTEKGYCVEYYHVFHQSTKPTKGIVFALPVQLEKLQRHGWLTFIDSTYKTNKYDWRLFTLYVRDTYECWNVGAHFFVSNEDCDTVSEALKIIRNSFCHWIPRYILSDQSSIEAKGIKKAFSKISAGKQECEIIFCVVHVMRTWMMKIYEKKTRDVMNAAMHKRTKIGCEKLVQDAVNDCAVPAVRNYIKRNYMKNTQQWALWARQHSPLLLQVTFTNPLESFHSELKRLTSSSHGLIGMCLFSFVNLLPFSLFTHAFSFLLISYSSPFVPVFSFSLVSFFSFTFVFPFSLLSFLTFHSSLFISFFYLIIYLGAVYNVVNIN